MNLGPLLRNALFLALIVNSAQCKTAQTAPEFSVILSNTLANPKPSNRLLNIDGDGVPEKDMAAILKERNEPFSKLFTMYGPKLSKIGKTLHVTLIKSPDPMYKEARTNVQIDKVDMYINFDLAVSTRLNNDGFLFMACHEMGHIVGGFPETPNSTDKVFAAREGQSDYYATSRCLRELWKDDVNSNKVAREQAKTIWPAGIESCENSFKGLARQDLCIRSILAAKSTLNYANSYGGDRITDFSVADDTEVEETEMGYPFIQCRFDTAVAGALCPREFDFEKLTRAEKDIGETSCIEGRDKIGYRPRCWFKASKK